VTSADRSDASRDLTVSVVIRSPPIGVSFTTPKTRWSSRRAGPANPPSPIWRSRLSAEGPLATCHPEGGPPNPSSCMAVVPAFAVSRPSRQAPATPVASARRRTSPHLNVVRSTVPRTSMPPPLSRRPSSSAVRASITGGPSGGPARMGPSTTWLAVAVSDTTVRPDARVMETRALRALIARPAASVSNAARTAPVGEMAVCPFTSMLSARQRTGPDRPRICSTRAPIVPSKLLSGATLSTTRALPRPPSMVHDAARRTGSSLSTRKSGSTAENRPFASAKVHRFVRSRVVVFMRTSTSRRRTASGREPARTRLAEGARSPKSAPGPPDCPRASIVRSPFRRTGPRPVCIPISLVL
jgi:hypothetical protein